MNGYPKFLASRVMQDGRIAVAIEYGDEILVGAVSLNGLNIISRQFSQQTTGAPDKLKIQLFLNGGSFVSVPLAMFDEISYYKAIPDHTEPLMIERKNNA